MSDIKISETFDDAPETSFGSKSFGHLNVGNVQVCARLIAEKTVCIVIGRCQGKIGVTPAVNLEPAPTSKVSVSKSNTETQWTLCSGCATVCYNYGQQCIALIRQGMCIFYI